MIISNINDLTPNNLDIELKGSPTGDTYRIVTNNNVRYAILFDNTLCVVSDTMFGGSTTIVKSSGESSTGNFSATQLDLNSSSYDGVYGIYAPIYNENFNINLTRENSISFFNGNTFYVYQIGGYPFNFAPTEITSNGAIAIVSNPNFYGMTNLEYYNGNVGIVTRYGSEIWATPTSNGAEIIPSGGLSIVTSKKITHTIYLDGVGSSVWIKTEHNIENAFIETKIDKSIGSHVFTWETYNPIIGGQRRPNFIHYSTTAYDRPSLMNYTYEQLYKECLNNRKVNDLAQPIIKNVMKDIVLQFQDTVTSQQGKEEYFSKVAQFGKDNQTHLYPFSEDEENTLVEVIFIEGSPSEDDKQNSSKGEAGDNENYDGSDRYKEPSGDNTDNYKKGSREGSVGLFNDLYLVTNENIRALRSKIWTQEFFNILKINENPIDNVVSLKRFPFSPTTGIGQPESMRIGNINTGVTGSPLTNGVEEIVLGSKKINGIYTNFLDYQGSLTIFLPFIGYKPLDINTWLNCWIRVYYLVDLCQGTCKAILQMKRNDSEPWQPVLEYDGVMGIDCNLTASTQKQSEIAFLGRALSSASSTALGLATGNPMGTLSGVEGMANNTVNNAFQSTTCGGAISNSGYLECFIIREFPETATLDGFYPNGYLESVGMPNMRTRKIGDFSGYVKVGGHVSLSNFNATREEKEEIADLLTKGVII